MIYYAVTLPKNLKQVVLQGLSDWHTGNPYCSTKHIDRQVDLLGIPDHYAVLVGDLGDYATLDSKADVFQQKQTPQEQAIWIKGKLTSYKKKMLGAVAGNHDLNVYKRTGYDVMQDIAEFLGCPYRRDGMLLKMSFGSGNNSHPERPYTYWIYFTHGYGGARTSGAKIAKAERTASYLHADVYISAHDHVEQAQPISYLMPDPRTHQEGNFQIGKVREHRKLLVKTGAALKWGGYSERGGYPPSQLGTPLIKFAGTGEPRVTVEL